MKVYSPLRYPGGKNKLAKFVALLCNENKINGHYVEPYAGGASVALFLLIEGVVSRITINDKDKAVYAFWHSVLFMTDELCELIVETPLDLKNWLIQRDIHRNKAGECDLLKLGFSTLYLNRTNFSGVLDGGPIGGLSQSGKYKIDCRFNKEDIIKRIRLISMHKECIDLENLDAIDLIKKIEHDKNTIFYFDPPYFLKGQELYMNHYKPDDHFTVANEIKKIKKSKWIVSYDNVEDIQKLYRGYNSINYGFKHTVRYVRDGKESIFFGKRLIVPKITDPIKLI